MSRQQMTDEQEQEEAMSDIKALSAAMSKVFATLENATKGNEVKAGPIKYRYADLAAVIKVIKSALEGTGLWFTQRVTSSDGTVTVETIIHHESGQTLACGELTLPVLKRDPQGYGSAISYCRRYSLLCAFGVATEDDDGADAGKKDPNAPDEVEVESVLSRLREAAMGGTDALQAAFKALPGSDAKAAVWATHGASLKAAAARPGLRREA